MKQTEILFPCKKLSFRNKREGLSSCLFKRILNRSWKFFNKRAVKLFRKEILQTYLMVRNDSSELRPIGFFRNGNLQVEIKFNCKFHNLEKFWLDVFGLLVLIRAGNLKPTERPVSITPGLGEMINKSILTC